MSYAVGATVVFVMFTVQYSLESIFGRTFSLFGLYKYSHCFCERFCDWSVQFGKFLVCCSSAVPPCP